MFGKNDVGKKDHPVQRPPNPPRDDRPGSGDSAFGSHEPDPDQTQGLIDQLQNEAHALRADRDDLDSKWKRAMADFQNFQRRAAQNEIEAKRQGVTSVLYSVIPVLDNFDLALAQTPGDDSARRILEGVSVIRSELVRALEVHGVSVINPQPGDEFDPQRHQAVTQIPAEGVELGRVASTFQVGYALGERVVRSAKVAVAS